MPNKKKAPAPPKTKRRKADTDNKAKPTDPLTTSISAKRHHIDTLNQFSERVRDESGLIADRSKLFQLFAEIIDLYEANIEVDLVTNVSDLRDAIVKGVQKKHAKSKTA